MFKFRIPWGSKERAPRQDVQGKIPKSFMMASDNQILRVSMEDAIADFVDIDFKQLTYAEVASMSKNKTQARPAPRVVRKERKHPEAVHLNEEEIYTDVFSDEIKEKFKINNHFSKKIFKSSDRRKK